MVNFSTADFEAAYIASPSRLRGTATVVKLTILPNFFLDITLATSRQKTKVPNTFVLNIFSTTERGVSKL
ncbi:hypothetical protein ES703_81017 [subsurface metagenome]